MSAKSSKLSEAFVEDHRHLTQGLTRLLEAVRAGDVVRAVEVADALDQAAGPHVRFEEDVFYPQVAKARGPEFVGRLYREHRVGVEAIEAILKCRGASSLVKEERDRLLQKLEATLEHTISCGTLLSYVTSMEPDRQAEMLAQLETFRRQPCRWSELPRHHVVLDEDDKPPTAKH